MNFRSLILMAQLLRYIPARQDECCSICPCKYVHQKLKLDETSVGILAFNRSSEVLVLSGAAPLSYSDFAYRLSAAMNFDVSLIAPKNLLNLNIPIFYPRKLACLYTTAMTAASGISPKLVAYAISDLRVEYLIEHSPANHSFATQSGNN